MKISYGTHYASGREDSRHVSTMAAFMERMRNIKPKLSMPGDLSKESFELWRTELQKKVRELLRLDELLCDAVGQPSPKLIERNEREGYTVERWECYPDGYTALPFLVLIPDDAREKSPAPGIMCLPGSIYSKEFIAGEPLLEGAACRFEKYPDRNRMALYAVRCGAVAFAFDNPETAERALEIERDGDYGSTSRSQLCHGLIQCGYSYFGITVAGLFCALEFIKNMPIVDKERIGIFAHSLGCDAAMYLGLLSDDVRAVVFNDLVCDEMQRYYSTTEYDERAMANNSGNWHEVPGSFSYYSRPDVLAALAPKYLALSEGGAEYYIDKVREAYRILGAQSRLLVSHYPKYREESSRSKIYEPPRYGLNTQSYFEFTNTDAPDHSFRGETAEALYEMAFGKRR